MDEMKRLLTCFCQGEYGEDSEPDFSDLHHVNFLYSTDGDNDEHDVNVEADLIDFELRYLYDGKIVYKMKAENAEVFTEWLDDMDWQDEYGLCVRNGWEDDNE